MISSDNLEDFNDQVTDCESNSWTVRDCGVVAIGPKVIYWAMFKLSGNDN